MTSKRPIVRYDVDYDYIPNPIEFVTGIIGIGCQMILGAIGGVLLMTFVCGAIWLIVTVGTFVYHHWAAVLVAVIATIVIYNRKAQS